MALLYINGVSTETYGLKVLKRELNPLPSLTAKEVKLGGRDGLLNTHTSLGANTFKVTFSIIDDTLENIYNNIRGFIASIDPRVDEDYEFKFSDDDNVVRFAKLESGDKLDTLIGTDGSLADFTLTFKMRDPFIYSDLITITQTMSHGGTITINNDGLETPLVILGTVPDFISNYPSNGIGSVNPGEYGGMSGIKFAIGSEYIKCTGGIPANSVLLLDTKEYKLEVDGINRLRFWEGGFPILNKGTNVITMTNDLGEQLNVVIKYRKRWM